MRKSDAEKIAKSGITWGQIQAMMQRAFDAGAADERRSIVNKSFTKATSFNVLVKCVKEYEPDCLVDNGRPLRWLAARHCLVEFGEFWDGWRPERVKQTLPKPHHQPAIDPELPF